MSCGEPHETDCSEVLDRLYEYLDRELPERDSDKFREHFHECAPCLEKYGLEQAVKKLVRRCCGHDHAPGELRAKVMDRIELIRAGEAVPEQTVLDQPRYSHGNRGVEGTAGEQPVPEDTQPGAAAGADRTPPVRGNHA